MTTYQEMLRSIDLGQEVAEQETDLAEIFVPTADYHQFTAGKGDLVTGVKGVGKSALFLMALNQGVAGVNLVPAQEIAGAGKPLYEVATSWQPVDLSEAYFRDRWALHIALLAANKVVSLSGSVPEPMDLALRGYGVELPGFTDPLAIWRQGARLMEMLGDRQGAVVDLLLRSTTQALDQSEQIIWVMFDRLDDVFATQPETERLMLRGLLHAHLLVSRYSNSLRPKLFLRHDLLGRITANGGLRNLDKTTNLRLNVNAYDVSRLIIKRLARSSVLADWMGPELEDVAVSMSRVLPRRDFRQIGRTKRPSRNLEDYFGHLFGDTADGSGRYAPRNVLAYLRFAVAEQERICERKGLDLPPRGGPLLSDEALKKAWSELGENRLRTYIYAEFPDLKPFVERLSRGKTHYTLGELRVKLFGDAVVATDEMLKIVKSLEYCGVLNEERDRKIVVARLYRPALLLGSRRI